MQGRNCAELSASRIHSGIAGDTPVAAVSKASTPEEQVVMTTLGELASAGVGAAPLILLIGHAIQRGP